PDHYRQWSGSMHAYAGVDPVFRAMEAKGQAETGGALGDFCVQCHAPLAHRLGLARTAADLDDLPAHLGGVTCAFCHQVDAVEGSHNNPLRLALDGVMRGPFADPRPNPAHPSAYSPLHDRQELVSSDLCGTCHDIVNGDGVHLERTYAEWQASLYSSDDPLQQNTCGRCHMPGRNGVAADRPGVPLRRVHDHGMAGVDVALTDFPEREAQRAAVQRLLDGALVSELCVVERQGGAEVELYLENIASGHAFPSGATLDRRVWVELTADAAGERVYQSGVVPDGTPLRSLDDPDLWAPGSRGFDENGNETHDFWDVARLESDLLPAPTTLDPLAPDYVNVHVPRRYRIPSAAPLERIDSRVRLRPMGLDVLDDLIGLGLLDPAIRDAMPTFTLGATALTWTREAAELRISPLSGREALCVPRL
ncbi:MAG: hypothetical protein KC549_13340, partial [Myxococcales bacterium]|nr:hypothetical protein [Myxococcales bacterium]